MCDALALRIFASNVERFANEVIMYLLRNLLISELVPFFVSSMSLFLLFHFHFPFPLPIS